MTPMASIGGRSWTILPWGAGISAETAWVTAPFLVDPDRDDANLRTIGRFGATALAKVPGQRSSTGRGSACSDREAPGRASESHVKSPQTPRRGHRRALAGRLVAHGGDQGGLDDDDRVELEAVGLVGRQDAPARRPARRRPGPGGRSGRARPRRGPGVSSPSMTAGPSTATRPGATAATSWPRPRRPAARPVRPGWCPRCAARSPTGAPAGAGAMAGAATARTRAATSTTSAGVR